MRGWIIIILFILLAGTLLGASFIPDKTCPTPTPEPTQPNAVTVREVLASNGSTWLMYYALFVLLVVVVVLVLAIFGLLPRRQ